MTEGRFSVIVCHLVTKDFVNNPFAVRIRVDFAAVVVAVIDARGRTRFVVGAFTPWVHQVCCGRLCNPLARLAHFASFELSTKRFILYFTHQINNISYQLLTFSYRFLRNQSFIYRSGDKFIHNISRPYYVSLIFL